MPHRLPSDGPSSTIGMEDAFRVLEALGPMPGEALAAMVDYGLNDVEIGRYFGLPHDMIAILRQHWGIDGNP